MQRFEGFRGVAVLVAALALALGGCGRDEEDTASGGGGGGGGSAPGVTDTSIKLGTTTALSGPASAYGTIARASKAHFDMVNAQGGVNGRKIEYKILDDGYDPAKAVSNARRLVTQEKVFAVFNSLGTANNLAIWDYLNQQKVPQTFVATGASDFGKDPDGHPYTIGWQPDYQTEAKAYAEFLKQEKPGAKVAILFQNDSFGKDLMKGFEDSIAGSRIKIVARESYEVTDPTVSPQVVKLAKSGADTFLNIATPKPAAQAIGTVAKSGWKPLHILNNVSASKALVLQPVGLEAAQGIYTLSYFKDPEAAQFASDRDVQDYKANLKKYGPKLDPNNTFNVYGWLAAATMVETLKQTGKELDRDKLMDTIRNLDVEIPMLYGKVKTGAGDGFPIQTVQIQQFKDENWEPIGEQISTEQ